MPITPDDLTELTIAGRGPSACREFYELKDAVLDTYGEFDGYDLQVWYDTEPARFGPAKRLRAEHRHILERVKLGERVFHKPTDEFYFRDFRKGVEKYSPRFFELAARVRQTIAGKKTPDCSRAANEQGKSAFKRLTRKFGRLLKRDNGGVR